MTPRRSTFEQLLGGLGRALEEADQRGRGKRGAAEGATEAQRVAAAWLVGRTLRPRHINWPRLVAATATGVVLGEVLMGLGPRRNGRALPPGRSRVVREPDEAGAAFGDEAAETGEEPRAEPPEYAAEAPEHAAEGPDYPAMGPEHTGEGPEYGGGGPRSARRARALEAEAQLEDMEGYYAEPEPGPRSARRARAYARSAEAAGAAGHVRALLERIGGDLAVAAAYASVAYPRLPGPPFVRAAMFGAADAAVATTGGITAMLAGFAPRLKLPLRQLLIDEERAIERSLALALALGLIYRDSRYDD